MGLLKSAGDLSRKVILLKEKTAFEHGQRIECAAVSALISSLLQETARKTKYNQEAESFCHPRRGLTGANCYLA